MSRRAFEAFQEKFDAIRKRGLSNLDAFDEADQQLPTYKNAESFLKTRTYHRRKKKKS